MIIRTQDFFSINVKEECTAGKGDEKDCTNICTSSELLMRNNQKGLRHLICKLGLGSQSDFIVNYDFDFPRLHKQEN